MCTAYLASFTLENIMDRKYPECSRGPGGLCSGSLRANQGEGLVVRRSDNVTCSQRDTGVSSTCAGPIPAGV